MKIAIVGSGVSGLAATWLLNKFSDHEVHLYEADNRPGGHANTVTYARPDKKGSSPVDVDTGFIVFNPSTYPNFINFLNQYPDLKSRILPTEMTFSVSRDRGAFEWAGNNIFTVFCQPSRLLDISMWRLLYDVLRFNACARRLVIGVQESKRTNDSGEELSIGEYLENEGYSDSFRDDYLVPMTAAIWSTPPDKCALDFPARTLVQFMNNHHLLQVTGKPSWLTIRGGSRTYVERILSTLPKSRIHLSTPVHSISSSPGSPVELCPSDGRTETFDHVILACHSDTALKILQTGEGTTKEEERILGSFQWNRNEAVLHCDTRLMPKKRIAWSCWNYLTTSAVGEKGERKANVNEVALTYWMNDLQHIPEKEHGPVLVTLNPPFEPSQEKFFGRYKYDHPVLDSKAIHAQREMHTIQNTRGISYAGAWLYYGFHEDGFTSGLRAAMSIDKDQQHSIQPPFDIVDADREPEVLWAATLFDVLEGTSLRVILGAFLGIWVTFVKNVLGLIFDLGHLEDGGDRAKRGTRGTRGKM